MSDLLEVRDLHAFYGKSHVLHGVNLRVGRGEIVSLLGRNGVGRSTTVKAVMGQLDATGSVVFNDEQILGLPAFRIAHKGLGYVPESRCHQLLVATIDFCTGQFAIAGQVLWAQSRINHICNTLTTFGGLDLILLAFEETVPVILLCNELL